MIGEFVGWFLCKHVHVVDEYPHDEEEDDEIEWALSSQW